MAVKWKWKPAAGGAVSPELTNRLQTLENEAVKKTGDQSIGGNKTFTQPLTVATPTQNNQATTKEYVDNKIKDRVIDATIGTGTTYVVQASNGYKIINLMVGRKRTSDSFYFFTHPTVNLNFQFFAKSDGSYNIYTEGNANGFNNEYKIYIVEKKL